MIFLITAIKDFFGLIGDILWFVVEFWYVTIIIIGLVIGLYVVFRAETLHDLRFMAACLHDHKEYECESLLKGTKPQIIYTPIIISH